MENVNLFRNFFFFFWLIVSLWNLSQLVRNCLKQQLAVIYELNTKSMSHILAPFDNSFFFLFLLSWFTFSSGFLYLFVSKSMPIWVFTSVNYTYQKILEDDKLTIANEVSPYFYIQKPYTHIHTNRRMWHSTILSSIWNKQLCMSLWSLIQRIKQANFAIFFLQSGHFSGVCCLRFICFLFGMCFCYI